MTPVMGVTAEGRTNRASLATRGRRSLGNVDNRNEVREFLMSRRARVTPSRPAWQLPGTAA